MIRPSDIENRARQTGYNHVQYSGVRNGSTKKPYQAIAYGGKLDRAGRSWKGPRRATALESAQDYCDHVNGGHVVTTVHLARAGHTAVVNPDRVVVKRAPQNRPLRSGAGHVYCISDGTALKIGMTTDHPSNRIASLQTGNPRLLTVLASVEVDDAIAAERILHEHFMEYNLLGEWFQPHPSIFVAFGLEVPA